MYCEKCGKYLPLFTKFCQGCGAAAPVRKWSKVGIALLFSVLAAGLVLLTAYLVSISGLPDKITLQQMLGYSFLFCFFAFWILLILKIILSLRRHPIRGTIWLIILVGLISVSAWGFYRASFGSASLRVAVVKGPVSGAAVSIYELKDNGERGKLIAGPRTSDASGNANFYFLINLPKRLLIEAKGGSYTNEATGEQIQLKDGDVFTAVLPAGAKTVAVTPFTHMAAALAKAKIQRGEAPDQAVISANEAVAKQYGLTSVLDLPSEDNGYSQLLGGFAQLAKNLNAQPGDLVEALAKDWSDGQADGKENNQAITVAGGKKLGAAGTSGLTAAKEQFAKSGQIASPKEGATAVNPPATPAPANFRITTTSLPAWVSGQAGKYTLAAEGGSLPLRWTVISGGIPEGFSLSEDGIISGNYTLPSGTTKKIFPKFTVQAKDQKGQTKSVELSVTVVPQAPKITVYNPAALVAGKPCDEKIATASGGMPPYRFYRRSGAVPAGTDTPVRGNDVYFAGTPQAKGNFSFQICVVDSADTEKCGDVAVAVKEEAAAPAPTPETPAAGEKWDGAYRGTCTLTSSSIPSELAAEDPNICNDDKRIYCPPYFFTVIDDYIWNKGAHRASMADYSKSTGGDIDSSGATIISEAETYNNTTSDWALHFYLSGGGKYVEGTFTHTFECSWFSIEERISWTRRCSCTYSLSGGPATAN